MSRLSPSALRGGGQTVPSLSLSGPAVSGSLLDNWEKWPENDPRFVPWLDNAWPLRNEFCKVKDGDCKCCLPTRQVCHISEYTESGQRVMNEKVDTNKLHEHLKHLEQLDKSEDKPLRHPSVRLFFACGNFVQGGLRSLYMRHFLSYCQIPPRMVLKRRDANSLPAFQAAYEAESGMLHIYLQCFSYVTRSRVLSTARYYSAEVKSDLVRRAEESRHYPMSPTLYLRYHEPSREVVIYVSDSTITFQSLRDIFSSDVRAAKQDPFLLVAVFLQLRISEFQEYLSAKQRMMDDLISECQKLTSLDTNRSTLFDQFGYLAQEGPNSARMKHEVSSILRALKAIEAEHALFLERSSDEQAQGDSPQSIGMRFRQQHEQVVELESAYSALVSSVEIVKDLLVGRAQVVNGIDLATMTRDNQKQAEATEALARDARRDSEIMKTITVVTLIYLPATFVSTLLSMGIFDFGIGSDGDGRIRIAPMGWIFIAIAVPLTALTLILAFLWKRSNERQWQREENVGGQRRGEPTEGDGNGPPEAVTPVTNAVTLAPWQTLVRRLCRRPDCEPDLELGVSK